MTSISSSIPSNYANVVAPYAPLGRQPVGQESSDLKSSSFKALEQPSSSARSENRRSPDNNPGDQQRVEGLQSAEDQEGSASQTSSDDKKEEQAKAAQKAQLLQDQAKIAELSARDREVRAHERAHAAVGGQYASAPSYDFEKGPDGVNYAVSGEVSISSGAVPNDPEATIAKAQQIRAAANAPADPSGPDRAVAAAADSMEANARAELSAKQSNEVQEQERKQEENIKAEKAEEAKKFEKEEAIRKEEHEKLVKEEEKLALTKEEERVARSRADRIDAFNQLNKKTFDLNRHLVEIGAVSDPVAKGGILNQRV